MERLFHCNRGSANKFWSVSWDENNFNTIVTIRYGRIGTEGQIQTKHFNGSQYRRNAFIERKIREKLGKGYIEMLRKSGSKVNSRSDILLHGPITVDEKAISLNEKAISINELEEEDLILE